MLKRKVILDIEETRCLVTTGIYLFGWLILKSTKIFNTLLEAENYYEQYVEEGYDFSD